MTDIKLKDVLSDGIHYWERARIVYNLVLTLIVAFYFFKQWPASKGMITTDLIQTTFVLAVLANVAFCSAYVVDTFVQLSTFRSTWLRFRWLLFLIGLVFASVITRTISSGFFHQPT